MVFNTGAALLDAIVLAVVSREDYDRQFDGRNRRYYKVTETGRTQLIMYRKEWKEYSGKINELFEGGILE